MPDFLDLLTAYLACDTAAKTTSLRLDQILMCQEIYLHLKLSFLPDLDRATYATLDAADRAAVARDSYAAWYSWREDNAGIVATARARALEMLPLP